MKFSIEHLLRIPLKISYSAHTVSSPKFPSLLENIFGKTSKSYSKRQINNEFLVSKWLWSNSVYYLLRTVCGCLGRVGNFGSLNIAPVQPHLNIILLWKITTLQVGKWHLVRRWLAEKTLPRPNFIGWWQANQITLSNLLEGNSKLFFSLWRLATIVNCVNHLSWSTNLTFSIQSIYF